MSFTKFPSLIGTITYDLSDSEDGRYVRRTSSRVRRTVSSELITTMIFDPRCHRLLMDLSSNTGVTLLFSACSVRGSMQYPLAIAIVVGTLTGLIAWDDPCPAQTITVQDGTQNQVPQNPQAGQVQPPLSTRGVSRSIITPETTRGLMSSPVISSLRMPVSLAGRATSWFVGRTLLKRPNGRSRPFSQLYASSRDWHFVLRPVD